MKYTLDLTLEQVKKIQEMGVDTGNKWPKKEDRYWYIDELGESNISTYENDEIDHFRVSIGNVFKTKAEAQNAHWVKKLQAETKVMNYIKEHGMEGDGEECYWIIYFGRQTRKLKIEYYGGLIFNQIHLNSHEAAKELIKKFPEELKLMLGVK